MYQMFSEPNIEGLSQRELDDITCHIIDNYKVSKYAHLVSLFTKRLRRFTGISLSDKDMFEILLSYGFDGFVTDAGVYYVYGRVKRYED